MNIAIPNDFWWKSWRCNFLFGSDTDCCFFFSVVLRTLFGPWPSRFPVSKILRSLIPPSRFVPGTNLRHPSEQYPPTPFPGVFHYIWCYFQVNNIRFLKYFCYVSTVKFVHHKYIIVYPLDRSQDPRSLRLEYAAARILGLRVRIPLGAWMSVTCGCCVL